VITTGHVRCPQRATTANKRVGEEEGKKGGKREREREREAERR